MRIKSIQLKPFAGIIDKKVEFSPGLTVLLGPNEAGKSTLLNALKSALFTEVNLTKNKFDKLMRAYMPAQGGDTIRVYLTFQAEEKEYALEKIWKAGGKQGSSVLRFDDQREFTGDSEVSRLINEFLPAQEGTIRNILLTWQSALNRTINVLDSEGKDVRSDLGIILRSSIMETDGISVDRLKERLDREYEAYFQHWDIESGEPENGRGINNPYKKEVGKILKAYYDAEGIRKNYEEANGIERELDELNKKIQDKESEQNKIQDELKKYEGIKSQIQERQQAENDVKGIELETGEIKKISREWPIKENWLLNEADSKVRVMEKKMKEIKEEERISRKNQENKEFRKRFEKLQALRKKVEEANNKLSKVKIITREDMKELQKKKQEIREIENIIMVSKLKFSLVSKIRQKFIIKDTTLEKKETLSLKENEKIEKTFQGKLMIEHKNWNMEIQAGEGEIDQLIAQKEEKAKAFKSELEKIGVDSLEKAQSINDEYETNEKEVMYAERALKEELREDIYERLEEKQKNLREEKQVRPLEEISSEKTRIEIEIENLQKKKQEAEKQIKEWKEAYESHDKMISILGDKQYKQRVLNERLKKLAKLPDGFVDYKSFYEYMNELNGSDRKIQEEISTLREQKITAESKKPDQSSEELKIQLDESEQNFQRTLLAGKSVAHIKEKTSLLLGKMDLKTYEGFQNKFEKYFIRMSGNSFSGIEMEDDYPKKLIKGNGSELTHDLLSFGTKDTFSLALRLTMAEYFLRDKSGFLILDDPLVDMDSGRQTLAAEQINEFAKTKQVIFLTCHHQTAEMLNGKCIEMTL